MTSKHSSGPNNPKHKKFLSNDKSIMEALCFVLSSRRIDIRAVEIYKRANLSSPTFYLHYRNTDDARQRYEERLKAELARRIPNHATPRAFFTVLVNFIVQRQQYFIAVSKSCDHYLLTEILAEYQKLLVGDKMDERSFLFYSGNLQIAINYWLRLDESNPTSADHCVEELLRIQSIAERRHNKRRLSGDS